MIGFQSNDSNGDSQVQVQEPRRLGSLLLAFRLKEISQWKSHSRMGSSAFEDFCSSSIAVEYKSMWHFSRKDLEDKSPSKKDGIDWRRESEIRVLYCSFLQNLGIELRVPQLTIATAIMFCHRFYLHQSHAKNNWQTIATVCMFLASKVEGTPCSVAKVIGAAWKVLHRNEITSTRRIHLKENFPQEKAKIFIGERLLLSTIGFDFNVQHPYKPLVTAIKKFKLQQDLTKIAWNFVNDWLRTTLCLQYKPHYIAAGSLYVAARLKNVELPSRKGSVWWQEFDVMPQHLQDVIRQMMQQIGFNRTGNAPSAIENTTKASLLAPAAGIVDMDCPKARKTNTLLPAKEVASDSPDSVLTQARSNSPSLASKDSSKDGSKTAFPRHSCSSIAACSNIKNTKSNRQPEEFKRNDRTVHNGGRVCRGEGNPRTGTRISTSNKVASISVGSDKEEMERSRSKLKRRWERETQKSTVDILVRARESGMHHETAFKSELKLARVSYR